MSLYVHSSLAPFEFKLAQTPRVEAANGLDRFAAGFASLQPQPGAVVSLAARRMPLTSRVEWLPLHDFLGEIRRLARV